MAHWQQKRPRSNRGLSTHSVMNKDRWCVHDALFSYRHEKQGAARDDMKPAARRFRKAAAVSGSYCPPGGMLTEAGRTACSDGNGSGQLWEKPATQPWTGATHQWPHEGAKYRTPQNSQNYSLPLHHKLLLICRSITMHRIYRQDQQIAFVFRHTNRHKNRTSSVRVD